MEMRMIAKCVRKVFIVLCFDVIKKRGYFYPCVIKYAAPKLNFDSPILVTLNLDCRESMLLYASWYER